MAFENVNIAHGNLTIDRSGSSFYTMDHTQTRLIQKNSSGTVIFSYFLDRSILEVVSLEFDGFYFWSLERQGSSGFRIRKWEIGADDLVRAVLELSFITSVITPYDVYTLAVEHYSDTLAAPVSVGATSIDVVSGAEVRIGDEIIIGPSTSPGFTGEYSTTTVTNKVANTLTLFPALDADFSTSDELYFTRSFYVFSDTAVGNQTGALYKFRATDGFIQAVQVSNAFNLVRAATFFKDHVLFVRAGEIIWIDPDSLSIAKSQAIDNLDTTRSSYIGTFDLAGFSDTIYRLEQEHVFFDGGSETWMTEDWSPLYNYNTSNAVSEIYFIVVKAEPPILHKSVAGLPTEDGQSEILVQVLDQFRVPIFGRTVDLSSDGGSLSPTQDTTDADGIVRSTYTSDTSVGEVTITATVT